jgi:hypothetical protein
MVFMFNTLFTYVVEDSRKHGFDDSFAVGDKLIKIDGQKLSPEESLESLTRHIEGVAGSQVGSQSFPGHD